MESKKPWLSKMVWLNAIGGILSAALLFWPGAESAQAYVSAHGAEIGMAWSVLNIILRAVTKDKLSLVD